MTSTDEEFFLIVGGANSESTTSRITAEGLQYRRKLLYSGPENWRKIIDLLGNSQLKAVIVVVTGNDYMRLVRDEYATVAEQMLDALAKVPHALFVHEYVFFAEDHRANPTRRSYEPAATSGVSFNWYDDMTPEEFFGVLPDDVRSAVNEMLTSRQLNVLPYQTNAERSVMAGRFLEDLDRHMLFRIYIPAGRLYAEEASTLLGLFRDWLNQTGRDSIRQDGYSTPSGQVYEFFGEKSQQAGELSRQFQDFSDFLDSCHATPDKAAEGLISAGVAPMAANQMVARYAKAGRRLQLDLRQTREHRLLSLRHQIESEFLGDDPEVPEQAAEWLNQLIPNSAGLPTALLGPSTITPETVASAHVTVNQQFFGSVQGSVFQNIQGTVHLGEEARKLLALIQKYGDLQAGPLQSSVHELEDQDARKPDRIVARQKLRSFLSSLGGKVTDASIATLQKYLEHRIGL